VKKTIHKIIREDNFLSLAGNLSIALFGISGFALLARSLQLDAFGQCVLFISSGSFIEMFRFGITNTGLIRYLSGADDTTRLQFIGSNVLIGLGATIGLSAIMIICNVFFHDAIARAGYGLFFTWYPLLAFINLPWNNALVVLQADRKFGKILFIKAINNGVFFFVILLNFFWLSMSLAQLIYAMLIINAATSLICVIAGWDGMKHIRKANAYTNKTLLHFGKYTTFTLIGTNLLRSADSLIISLSPMGVTAVALYSIPMKLTELQQIPLRSFVATAFPKMSKASIQGKVKEVKDLFYTYAGAMSYLFIFVSLFTFIFADFFVWILAGKQYLQNDGPAGMNAVNIVRVFSLYGLLLPIDRMTGIGLDSINKPGVNALKVFFMLFANIIGDIIAIYVFKSLVMVAVASILFTMLGIWIGMFFLNKELSLSYREIFSHGATFYKTIFQKVTRRQTPGMINV